MDYTYVLPEDFDRKVYAYLKQRTDGSVANAFFRCKYDYELLNYAHYEGIGGDTWNKYAVDFDFEGAEKDISILEENKKELDYAINKSLKPSTSGLLLKNLSFLYLDDDLMDDSFSTNDIRLNIDISKSKSIYNDIIKVSERLCNNAAYNEDTQENSINDYIRDGLCFSGYTEVKDQSRHGVSLNGENAGEVDILLSKENKDIAIFEGLCLDSVNTSYISDHIDKAIVNYNALGTPTFIVAYVDSSNFTNFWKRYSDYLKNYEFPLVVKSEFDELIYPNAAIRSAMIVMSRDEFDFPVYFIAINIRK